MIPNPLLKAYWIESSTMQSLAFGVTAFSGDDALQLLRESGYAFSADDPSLRITEGIQVADLDRDHIIPNMGPIVFRGVWYPRAHG